MIKSEFKLFRCMTTQDQYKLIYDNWRKHNKLLIEAPIYSYSGDPQNPEAGPHSKWDPESIEDEEVTGSAGKLDKQGAERPELSTTDTLGGMGALGGIAVASMAGENLPAIIMSALKIVKNVIVGVASTALAGIKGVAALAAKILDVLTLGTFSKVTDVVKSLTGGAIGTLLKAAGVTVAAGGLTALAYGLYKAYKAAKGDIPVDKEGNITSKGPAFKEGELVGLTKNFKDWPTNMQAMFCRENPNYDWSKNKMKNPCGSISAAGKLSGAGNSTLSTSDLEGKTYTIGNTGVKHNLTGSKKRFVETFVQKLLDMGITNKYILAGAIATAGKESGYKVMAEKGNYSRTNLKGNGAVASKVRRVFRQQGFPSPTDGQLKQLAGGGRNAIALFNIAYGYESFANELGKYNTYQLDAAIPLSKPVLVDGNINPELYDKNLSGYKYRGRGPLQTTFKETYKSVASVAGSGLDVDKILEDPDILTRDPEMAILFSAAQTKRTFNKAKINLKKKLNMGEPKNIKEGVIFMAYLTGGGGGNPKDSWYSGPNGALSKALNMADKHVRVDDAEAVS